MRLKFFVPGEAKPSGSKRSFWHKHAKKQVIVPDNPDQVKWQDKVGWYAYQVKPAAPIIEPVIMTCCFYRKRPKGHFRARKGRLTNELKPGYETILPSSKPDSFKLCRAVEDAMSGIIYKDDSLICDHFISKRYCNPGQTHGVEIIIETYEERRDVHYGKEERQKQGASRTEVGNSGRDDHDDGGNQSDIGGLPSGQNLFHGTVAVGLGK